MMERCGDLNQGLKKGLIGLRAFEPNTLPMLMGVEELLSPVAVQACCQRTVVPVKRSHALIMDEVWLEPVEAFGGFLEMGDSTNLPPLFICYQPMATSSVCALLHETSLE